MSEDQQTALEYVKQSRGLALCSLASLSQEHLNYLTAKGYVSYDSAQSLKSLQAHEGWKILEAFLAHYILRDCIGITMQETQPEYAAKSVQTPDGLSIPSLDGIQWIGGVARKAGIAEGLAKVLSMPAALAEGIENAMEDRANDF